MQFKVPQNIDMADRIVGPLTLIQFLYVLVGGVIVYFFFNTIGPVNHTLFFIIATPITLFTLAMAFLRIQDQPFPKFVVAFFVYLIRPKSRRWFKGGHDPKLEIVKDEQNKDEHITRKKISKSQLEQLIQVVDTGGKAPAAPGETSHPQPSHPPPMAEKSQKS